MTHSVSNLHEAQTVIVGVDTHKHMHVAVAIDSRGIRLGAHSFGADSEGYRERCSPGPRRMVASRPSALKGPAATASACPVRSTARVIGSWK